MRRIELATVNTSNDEPLPISYANWQPQYLAALIELSPDRVQRRIDVATDAIRERFTDAPDDSEQHALKSALETLEILRGRK